MNEPQKPQKQTLEQALSALTPLEQALAALTPETIAQALNGVNSAWHECATCRQCNELTPHAPKALLCEASEKIHIV